MGMIPVATKPRVVSQEGNRAVIEVEGLYPGYGQTIGNSLRRILLSSLPGAAITTIKIEGVGHEFSTIEGVAEDVVEIMLNLKQLRFRLYDEGPQTIRLSASGERRVLGKDFKTPSQVEIASPDLPVATLTSKKSRLAIEAVVERGLGYVPMETRSKDKMEVGTIALDATFSPVRHVTYEVENMRVGDRTDYHRLRLQIETDGIVSPEEAFGRAAQILVEQFTALTQGLVRAELPSAEALSPVQHAMPKPIPGREENPILRMKLDELKLSSRTLNVLREAGIKTVGGLARKRERSILEIEGLGEKGIQEIKKALGNLGIILKQ